MRRVGTESYNRLLKNCPCLETLAVLHQTIPSNPDTAMQRNIRLKELRHPVQQTSTSTAPNHILDVICERSCSPASQMTTRMNSLVSSSTPKPSFRCTAVFGIEKGAQDEPFSYLFLFLRTSCIIITLRDVKKTAIPT